MIYLHGAGGGGGESARTPVEDQNSLRSVARARIVDLLCEGEIGGLVNGLRSVYLNDTPLQAADGTYNFKDVGITVHNGTANQPTLPNSDGVESEIGVGVKVLQSTPVIRTISSADVDSVRVTIGVPSLVQVDTSNGDQHGTDLQYKLSVSCNGAAYVDLPLGSEWVGFSGDTTPVATKHLRGRVFWTPDSVFVPGYGYPSAHAIIAVEVSTNGGASYSAIKTQECYTEKTPSSLREVFAFDYTALTAATLKVRVVFDGVSNGTITAEHLEYTLPSGIITLSGKTTSRYQESYRVNLQALGAAPYSLKLTRITADSASANLQNELWWDSYTTIIEDKFSYPYSAVAGLEFNSEYFSSLPTRGYEMYLLIVKVPTNYNPITREYTGSWDGSWKMAWTDNPAWCFFDMATNPRYGAGEFIKADMLDKWAFYEMAQYCDELVPNGFGGLEPRFTCNLYMQTRQEAFRVMQDMASIFRAIQFWGPGGLMVDQDSPETPMYQFTNANVEQGKFNYTSANIKARHNAVLVTWNDPDDMYRQKVEYVDDQELIATWGYLSTSEVVAIGCTSRSQARRLGKWLLYTERYEAETVSFATGLEGAIPSPGAVVQLMDSKRAGLRHGGRLLAAAGLAITLDAPVTLVSGTHTITVINADGQPETRTITTGATTTDVLTIDSAWTVAPEPNAVWVLTSPVLEPTFWRVLSVAEKDGGSKYEITGLRHYPGKFAFVEENDPLPPPINSTLPATKQAPPIPAGLVASGYLVVDSAKVERIRITASWQSIAGGLVRGYKVRYRRKGGSWAEIPESSSNSVDFAADDATLYTIEVAAVNVFGISGQWATLDYTPNVTRIIPAAPMVALEQSFVGSSCKIKWAAVDGAVRYKVEVWAASALRRTVSLGNVLRYDYTSQDATADGGPWRDVTFKVSAINATGVEGAQGTLNANNPAPAALTNLLVSAGYLAIFFKCDTVTEVDFAGVRVWLSTSSGFTPSDATLVYDGPDFSCVINATTSGSALVAGTTYYVKAAGYDLFGKTGLNISGAIPVVPAGVSAGIGAGEITNAMIAALAASKITGQLTNAQIADLAAAKITGQLTNAQLADLAAAKITGQITGTQITDDAITSPKIAAGSITTAKIAADAVTANEIAAGAVTATELAAGSVTTAKLVAGAVTANEIAANAVTTAKLAAGAVTANEIAANTITAAKIASRTITASEISAYSITAYEILARSITADRIVANSITVSEIAAATITADRMNVSSLSAITANIGTVTAGKVQNAAGTNYMDLNASGASYFINTPNFKVTAAGAVTISGTLAAGSVFADNLVTTKSVIPQAITVTTGVKTSTGYSLATATETQILSKTLDFVDADAASAVGIFVTVQTTINVGGPTNIEIKTYRNGSLINSSNFVPINGYYYIQDIDYPGTGTHTYTVKAKFTGSGALSTLSQSVLLIAGKR